MLKYHSNISSTAVTIVIVVVFHMLLYLPKVEFKFKKRNVFEVVIENRENPVTFQDVLVVFFMGYIYWFALWKCHLGYELSFH